MTPLLASGPVIPDFGQGSSCEVHNGWWCTDWLSAHWGDTPQPALLALREVAREDVERVLVGEPLQPPLLAALGRADLDARDPPTPAFSGVQPAMPIQSKSVGLVRADVGNGTSASRRVKAHDPVVWNVGEQERLAVPDRSLGEAIRSGDLRKFPGHESLPR